MWAGQTKFPGPVWQASLLCVNTKGSLFDPVSIFANISQSTAILFMYTLLEGSMIFEEYSGEQYYFRNIQILF